MEVRENENALDLYEHALAYLPSRAFPGRPRTPGQEPDLLPAA
jgi:hypothetical protein